MTERSKFAPVSAFSFYLRTGRQVIVSEPAKIEAKFNPWHYPGMAGSRLREEETILVRVLAVILAGATDSPSRSLLLAS